MAAAATTHWTHKKLVRTVTTDEMTVIPLAADQTPSCTGHELFQVWEPVSHGAEARLVLLEVPFQRLSDFRKREKQQLFLS